VTATQCNALSATQCVTEQWLQWAQTWVQTANCECET